MAIQNLLGGTVCMDGGMVPTGTVRNAGNDASLQMSSGSLLGNGEGFECYRPPYCR
jgi:hypothetical protein